MKNKRFNYDENSQNQNRRFSRKASSEKKTEEKTEEKGEKSGKGMSLEDKFKLVNETLNSMATAAKSVSDLVKERELTKRTRIENNTTIKGLDNDLERTLSAERIEIEKIQTDFKLNYKELENESEKNRLQASIIKAMIERIGSLTLVLSKTEVQYGIDHPVVLDTSNKLHELSINLTNQLNFNN